MSLLTSTEAEHPAPSRILVCPDCGEFETFDLLGYVPLSPERFWTCADCGQVNGADFAQCPFCAAPRDRGKATDYGRVPAATWEVLR